MTLKGNQRVLALLAGAASMIALVVAASLWAYEELQSAAGARKQSYDLIVRADAVLGDLIEAESGQRGYLLTGDERYLQTYIAVGDGLRGRLAALQPLTLSGAESDRLNALAPLLEAKLAHMAATVDLRRERGTVPVAAEPAAGGSRTGKRLMDSIRVEMDAFLQAERGALARHESRFDTKMRLVFAGIIAVSLTALLFALAFSYLFRRETQQRLKNLVHAETSHLLDVQEEMNLQLREINTNLQVSEDKLAVTLDSIGDAVIATDAEGRVTLLNPLAEQLTGWSRAEAIGREVGEIFRIVSQETRLPSTVPVMDTLSRGTIHGLANHTILIARHGSECAIADSCAPIRERGGKVVGAILIFRDVTREDATQRALRDQQFYTRSLIESNVDALMTTDPEGIITDVNGQMELLTGCRRDELIGAAFRNFFTDPERAQAGIDLALKENKVTDYELTARAADGTETAVSYNSSTLYDRDNKLQGVFAAARDITERERLYAMLQEKNAELEATTLVAEKASAAKSAFLSQMSHELRTPLNAVLGFAQVMETGTPLPTPSQKRSLDQILKAGWYLLELINEILDLAQIESGKLSLSREPVALDDVMRECRAMIEPQALLRGISMKFPELDGTHYVLADRTRVKQILINLLFNAIKYNKPGGSVTVACAVPAPQTARISVTDSGDGIPADKLAQLFQPFNRLGQEAGAEEGTGIGLVVAKRLVELMGGVIGVDSTVGTGTVFWVELELCARPQLARLAEHAIPVAAPAGKAAAPMRTMLYVEDNPANLQLVEELVKRRADLRLLSAADGKLGIALAREFLPDVILMDINLPGMNGIEAMKILHALPETAHIPVMALSANVIPIDIKAGLDAGFIRYLTKPIVINEFMDALDLALQVSAARVKNSNAKERTHDRSL